MSTVSSNIDTNEDGSFSVTHIENNEAKNTRAKSTDDLHKLNHGNLKLESRVSNESNPPDKPIDLGKSVKKRILSKVFKNMVIRRGKKRYKLKRIKNKDTFDLSENQPLEGSVAPSLPRTELLSRPKRKNRIRHYSLVSINPTKGKKAKRTLQTDYKLAIEAISKIYQLKISKDPPLRESLLNLNVFWGAIGLVKNKDKIEGRSKWLNPPIFFRDKFAD